MSPPNGRLSSRIRKMAAAAQKAEAINAKLAVAFGGAIRLKPTKITTSHRTTTISIDLEMDEVDSTRISRVVEAVAPDDLYCPGRANGVSGEPHLSVAPPSDAAEKFVIRDRNRHGL